MPQQPKRPVSELKPAELQAIVGEVQKLLWQTPLGDGRGGYSGVWDADKEGSLDTLAAIVGVFDEHELRPIDPPNVIGFKSVDEFIQHVASHYASPDERQDREEDGIESQDPEYWEGQPGGDPPTS